MSNIKISQMPQATSVIGNDIIPIVQSGVSKQTTLNVLDTWEDITSQITYTASSGVTVLNFTVYKKANTALVILGVQFSTAQTGVISLITLSNLAPLFQSYGVGTSYNANNTPQTVLCGGRITTAGVVSALTSVSARNVSFNIEFPLA